MAECSYTTARDTIGIQANGEMVEFLGGISRRGLGRPMQHLGCAWNLDQSGLEGRVDFVGPSAMAA